MVENAMKWDVRHFIKNAKKHSAVELQWGCSGLRRVILESEKQIRDGRNADEVMRNLVDYLVLGDERS